MLCACFLKNVNTDQAVYVGIKFSFSNTGGFVSFRLHEIPQTAYLHGALEVMAGLVIISQKMSIYLDSLASLKEKVSANHLLFACCSIHCKTIYWSCRLIPSLVLGYFRNLLHICLRVLRLKLENTYVGATQRFNRAV